MRIPEHVQKGLQRAYSHPDREVYVYADDRGDLTYWSCWKGAAVPPTHPDNPRHKLQGKLDLTTGEYGAASEETGASAPARVAAPWVALLVVMAKILLVTARVVLAAVVGAVLVIMVCCAGTAGHSSGTHSWH